MVLHNVVKQSAHAANRCKNGTKASLYMCMNDHNNKQLVVMLLHFKNYPIK